MALIFCDGFDHYNSAALATAKGWSGYNSSSSTTRFSYGLSVHPASTGMFRSLPGNFATLFCGFAMQAGNGYSTTLFCYGDAGTAQISVAVDGSGHLNIYRGNTGTTLIGGPSSYVLPLGAWVYIEVGATIATGTGGSVTIKANGATVLTVSGVNTSQTGNAFANAVYVGPVSNAFTTTANPIDDLYICDNSGGALNTYLGDQRVYTQIPTGAGASTQWTPNGLASNWQNVANNPPNTADYNSSSTPGQIDLYALPALPSVAAISAVQTTYYAEKDDASLRTIEAVIKSGATQVTGTANNLGASYLYYMDEWPTDPATGAAWLQAAVTALQIGIEEVA